VIRWVPSVRVPPIVADTVLAVAVTAFVVVTEVGERRNHEHIPTAGVLLLLLLAPALAMRRRFPGTGLVLVLAMQIGLSATRTAPGANVPAELIAPYSVAAYASRRVRMAVGVVAAAALVVVALPWLPIGDVRGGILGFIIGGAGAWLIGALVRARRDSADRLAERAARLERDRELLTRQAIAEERLRIARELHDVVAHNLSVVVVQAQALQPAVTRDPELARGLAVSIEDVGREALEEMRHLLGVLRGSGDGPESQVETLGPQPGLDRLAALAEQVRQAGLAVTVTVSGQPHPLPAAVALSAYRIVQEALTNVLKHAGPASTTVLVEYRDADLVLTISDDGRGAAAALDRSTLPSFGHGLVGMRERVALFGGELSAGPRPGGGYQVRARIPLHTEAA
jgi:signal transduction histidine kinase